MPWGFGLGPYRLWKVEQNFFPPKQSKKKVKGKKSVAEKQRMEIGVDDECNEPAKSHVKPSLEEVPKNSKKVRLIQKLVYFRLIGCHK